MKEPKFMTTKTLEQVEILLTAKNQLHDLLTGAEAALRPLAIAHGDVGILVTRHEPRRYTVALSDRVPFGETHEQILF